MPDALRQDPCQRRGDQRADEGRQHDQRHQRQVVCQTMTGMGLALRLAVEGDEDQPEGIQGGQEGTCQAGI